MNIYISTLKRSGINTGYEQEYTEITINNLALNWEFFRLKAYIFRGKPHTD